MTKKAGFTFVSLGCGSGGSVQGFLQAGGQPRFICDERPLELGNATVNLPNVLSKQVDFRWYYNRKQKGTDDLLSLIGLQQGQLDLLEGSVRLPAGGSVSTPTQLYQGLYDLFGLAKRILPKIVIAFGPSNLSQSANLKLLNAQVNVLRFAKSKEPQGERAYYANFRVLNAADFGAGVSKSYTAIVGVRADIAQAHGLVSDRAILSVFPIPAAHQRGTLGDALAGLELPDGEAAFWERMTLRDAKLQLAMKFLAPDPEALKWLPYYGAKTLEKLGYKKTKALKVYRTSLREPAPDFDFYDPADTNNWGLLHPTEARILTTSEIAAAVGLPPRYKFKGTDYERASAAAACIPPTLARALTAPLLALLVPPTKRKARSATLPPDTVKVHLAESLRSTAPKIRTYHCDTDLGDTYARDLQGGAPTEAHFDFLFDAFEIGELRNP